MEHAASSQPFLFSSSGTQLKPGGKTSALFISTVANSMLHSFHCEACCRSAAQRLPHPIRTQHFQCSVHSRPRNGPILSYLNPVNTLFYRIYFKIDFDLIHPLKTKSPKESPPLRFNQILPFLSPPYVSNTPLPFPGLITILHRTSCADILLLSACYVARCAFWWEVYIVSTIFDFCYIFFLLRIEIFSYLPSARMLFHIKHLVL
jgi:hypothetical protein